MGKQSIVGIQGTNDSSVVSKYSMISQQYFEDHILRYFVDKGSRRSPLINRGYYVRAMVIQHVFKHIHSLYKETKVQVLSLGAGFDSNFFRLTSTKILSKKNTVYFEVDFPDVVQKKAHIIRCNQALTVFLRPDGVVKPNETDQRIVLDSSNYKLIAADLRDLQLLRELLLVGGIDRTVPTFILSECAITYMDVNSSTALIAWVAREFENAMFVTYEQVHPDDGFGHVMVNHFSSINSPLHSIHQYPTAEKQMQRYTDLGWEKCIAFGMNKFFNYLIVESERQRIDKLEPFDEFEEWHLKCSHYVLVAAAKGTVRPLVPRLTVYNRSAASTAQHKTKGRSYAALLQWKHEVELGKVQRFGHAAAVLDNSRVLITGGFGSQEGFHRRLDGICVFNLATGHQYSANLESPQALGSRIHHTATMLKRQAIVILGGRTSPAKACGLFVLLPEPESSILSLPDESQQPPEDLKFIGTELQCTGKSPVPRWRHTAVAVDVKGEEFLVIFGGRTPELEALGDCHMLNTNTWIWTPVPVMQHSPSPRHSHACSAWGEGIIISGGLKKHMKPSCSISILDCTSRTWRERKLYSILPRYSHTSHVWNNKLFLVGGVNCYPDRPPGLAIIDLLTHEIADYKFPEQRPEYPLLMHNHTSVLDAERERIVVLGGGGNCFSFGTSFNKGAIIIPLDQFLPQ